jgi:Zn finger protein HypA/HybF involved in hydrogenase expression
MPFPVAPIKINCKDCGFSQVVPSQGDVVFMPSCCKKCGGNNLIIGRAGALDSVLGKIQRVLKG